MDQKIEQQPVDDEKKHSSQSNERERDKANGVISSSR